MPLSLKHTHAKDFVIVAKKKPGIDNESDLVDNETCGETRTEGTTNGEFMKIQASELICI